MSRMKNSTRNGDSILPNPSFDIRDWYELNYKNFKIYLKIAWKFMLQLILYV